MDTQDRDEHEGRAGRLQGRRGAVGPAGDVAKFVREMNLIKFGGKKCLLDMVRQRVSNKGA